ncbi:cholinesterase 1-like isoform X1 [Haliotis rufescens]|uniref:cholinesterase 1-like isoform X1 n=1 Tax=Haliotis rufescens TaxID=6454 RepID=UPI00201F971D|nr:cholinesterase 1-like isoform X1 [Haliotis rufescens]
MASTSWLALCLCQLTLATAGPTVTSSWGTVEGVIKTSPEGRKYNAYLGIPYALPPVGDLRFKKSQPNPGSSGIFKAKAFGPACPQLGTEPQDEDCLTINVFTPTQAPAVKRSVMVWIHGGGFQAGSAVKYDPWKMVTEGDVVVVTLQYRLNVLGFLSTGNAVLPGNYALWDMKLALQWVQDNIEGYGGNSSHVTLFGESAGSKAGSYLFLSKKAKGLFQKVIMQSGSATGYFSFRSNPREVAVALGKRVKCIPDTPGYDPADKDLLNCFQNMSVSTLVKYSIPNLGLAYYSADFTWSPVVDDDFVINNPRFMIHDSAHLERVGFYDLDLMVGVNNQEGGYMVGMAYNYGHTHNTSALTTIRTHHYYKTELVPLILRRLCGTFDNSSVYVIMNGYVAKDYPQTKLLTLYDVMDTQSDASIVAPSVEVANAHGRFTNRGKTYFYLFDHFPSFLANYNRLRGMVHARDLMYSFGISAAFVHSNYHSNVSQEEYQLSSTFVAIYTNFAKSSDPNPAVKGQLSRDWPQYDVTNQNFLAFSTKMAVKSHVYPKRVSTWLDALPKADRHCMVRSDKGSSNIIIG